MEEIKKEVEKDDHWLKEWAECQDNKENINVVRLSKLSKEGGEERRYYLFSEYEEVENNKNVKEELPSDIDESTTGSNSPKDDAGEAKELPPGKKRTNKIAKRYKQSLELDKMFDELCLGAPVSDSHSNLCRFRCPECHDNFRGWQALRNHVAKLHPHKKLTLTEVKISISKAVCHICQICSASILCDSVFIHRHLLHAHNNMYISQYRKMFGFHKSDMSKCSFSDKVVGNLCVYKCVQCGMKYGREQSFAHHLKSNSLCRQNKHSDYLISKDYHKCKLCNATDLCDKNFLYRHVKTLNGISFQ